MNTLLDFRQVSSYVAAALTIFYGDGYHLTVPNLSETYLSKFHT
ncbi:hypothetical protein ACHV9W_17580 [Acinetobacter johnsonii]